MSFAGSRNGYLAQVAVSVTSGSSFGYLSRYENALDSFDCNCLYKTCLDFTGNRCCYLAQVAESVAWLRYEV